MNVLSTIEEGGVVVTADHAVFTVFTLLTADYAGHRRAVAQPCVNGDWLSKGRMAKFDPAQIQNP